MPILIPFNPIHILSPVDVTDGENYEERQRGLPFINKCKGIIYSYLYKISLCYIYGEGGWMLVMDNRKLKFSKIDYSDRKICVRYKKRSLSILEDMLFSLQNLIGFLIKAKKSIMR